MMHVNTFKNNFCSMFYVNESHKEFNTEIKYILKYNFNFF